MLHIILRDFLVAPSWNAHWCYPTILKNAKKALSSTSIVSNESNSRLSYATSWGRCDKRILNSSLVTPTLWFTPSLYWPFISSRLKIWMTVHATQSSSRLSLWHGITSPRSSPAPRPRLILLSPAFNTSYYNRINSFTTIVLSHPRAKPHALSRFTLC